PLLWDVAWMPGGDRLLVVQIEPGKGFSHSIWEVPVDGAAPRKLNSLRLTPVKGQNLGASSLTIHPSGKLLAYQQHEGIVEQFWAIDNLAQFIKAGGGR